MNQNNFKEARPEKHDKNNKRHGQKKGRGRKKKKQSNLPDRDEGPLVGF